MLFNKGFNRIHMIKTDDVKTIIADSYSHVQTSEPISQLEMLEKVMPLIERLTPQKNSSFVSDLITSLLSKVFSDTGTIEDIMFTVMDTLKKRREQNAVKRNS